MRADPSGISNNRGVVSRIEDDQAVLAVGPSRTPIHLPLDELPEGSREGTWVVLDMQLSPPIAPAINEAVTADRSDNG